MTKTVFFLLLITGSAFAAQAPVQAPAEADYDQYIEQLYNSPNAATNRPEVQESINYILDNAQQIGELPENDPLRQVGQRVIEKYNTQYFKRLNYLLTRVIGYGTLWLLTQRAQQWLLDSILQEAQHAG